MPTAFRYSDKKYNDALMALGNIRIGTLHDFRKTEHKKGISDVNEGRKKVSHYIPHVTEKDVGSIHWEALSKFGAIQIEGGENINIIDASLAQEFNHPDCFVHCTSADYSSQVLQQFEGADSCVEIIDLIGFYRRLTETLNSIMPVRFLNICKVAYMQRHEKWNGKDWGVHPALIKEPEFKRQVEIRAIWLPKFSGPLAPVVINDIGLMKYCRAKAIPDVAKRDSR